MASSILRSISRKAAASNSSPNYSLRCVIDPAANYSLLRGVINGGAAAAPPRMMSIVSNGTFKSSSATRISTPPCLMLPPAFEGNNMVYKLYSLADNKVLNISGGGSSSSKRSVGDDDDIKLVSSSHGWLTLFNPSNCDLFLFNPLSGRHIKLPSIHTLPIPEKNLRGGFGCVTKVITSCSPEQDEEEDCRVMMSFGPVDRLAFCSLSSAEWTPIGDPYHEKGALYPQDDDDHDLIARMYEDFVYSSREKLFYCVTQFEDLEAWDLQDTGSPKVIPMDYFLDDENFPWAARSQEEMELKKLCDSLKFLVVAEESGDLFLVRRHIMLHMAPDGSYVDFDLDPIAADKIPYKTIGFDVHKYDPETCDLVYMDGSLDGLALFIGNNHAFAVSAASDELSGLKPNSIYFTDVNHCIPPKWASLPFGGHDLGIFNYEDQTFSPCYYPCDRQSIQRIIPAPVWFTPTPTPTPSPGV